MEPRSQTASLRVPFLIALPKIPFRIHELEQTNWLNSRKAIWWPIEKETNCGEKHLAGLTLSNIGGVFALICFGIVCSSIALAIEYVYFKRKFNRISNNVTFDDPSHAEPHVDPEYQYQLRRRTRNLKAPAFAEMQVTI